MNTWLSARQGGWGPTLAVLALLAAAPLTACGRSADTPQSEPAANSTAVDADAATGYVRPPQAHDATRTPDGGVVLSGQAEPNSRVRLMTPAGAADGGTVTATGAWSMPTPPGAGIFGLSEDLGGRIVQGEGYIITLPAPGWPAAQLHAGGGAEVLGDSKGGVRITAADFDAVGGAMVSGFAPAGASLKLTVDHAAASNEVKADARGRFSIAAPATLKPGPHHLGIQSANLAAQADIAVSRAGPISGQPYRAVRQHRGWRVDWMTPGGGVQTSLILDP